MDLVQIFRQERTSKRTVKLIIDVPVPQILEETVEVVLAPHDRVQQQPVDVPMPQVLEETVEVVRLLHVNGCNNGLSVKFWKRQSRWSNRSRRNGCNGPPSKLWWLCSFHKLRRTPSMSSAKQIVDVPFPQVDVKGVPEYEAVAETVSSNPEEENLAATSLTASSLMLVKASEDERCHSTAQTSEAARRPP